MDAHDGPGLALYLAVGGLLSVGCSGEPGAWTSENMAPLRRMVAAHPRPQTARRTSEHVASRGGLPPAGECWSDADCDAGESCSGRVDLSLRSAVPRALASRNARAGAGVLRRARLHSCIAQLGCQPVTEACFVSRRVQGNT